VDVEEMALATWQKQAEFEHDDRKLRELVLLICKLAETDKTFGKVKLNKLLFFADFEAHLTLGKPITGQEYQKLPHGPAPPRLLRIFPEFRGGRRIKQDLQLVVGTFYGKEQEKPIAPRDPDVTVFSDQELALVTKIVKRFWGKTAKEVSDFSHRFPGWEIAEIGETIPYFSALIENRTPPSPRQIKWAIETYDRLKNTPPVVKSWVQVLWPASRGTLPRIAALYGGKFSAGLLTNPQPLAHTSLISHGRRIQNSGPFTSTGEPSPLQYLLRTGAGRMRLPDGVLRFNGG
jgi:hypothetical protein